jgi:hypothetical protein
MKRTGLSLLLLVAFGYRASAETIFIANLTGDQETPPLKTNAGGLGVFVLSDDQTQLTMVIGGFDFDGAIVASHIHNADCGQFGFVSFGISGSDFQNPVHRVWSIPPAMVQALLDGRLYVNIHTEEHPGGEIRGQILPPGQSCP